MHAREIIPFSKKKGKREKKKDVMTNGKTCQKRLGKISQNPKRDFYIFYKIVDCD
jgi:hypothetical protein